MTARPDHILRIADDGLALYDDERRALNHLKGGGTLLHAKTLPVLTDAIECLGRLRANRLAALAAETPEEAYRRGLAEGADLCKRNLQAVGTEAPLAPLRVRCNVLGPRRDSDGVRPSCELDHGHIGQHMNEETRWT